MIETDKTPSSEEGLRGLLSSNDINTLLRVEDDEAIKLSMVRKADFINVSVFPLIRSSVGQIEALGKLRIDCYIFSADALRDFIRPRAFSDEVKDVIDKMYERGEGVFDFDE